ncbi:MAG: PQQ-binding-like beta-propeller repeat protein [Thermoanaerobaculia bacterium]|nr:PQQ-binding-like beta-propeller repeat protein [Thermoanaerobaculia bacterium]
MTNSLRCPVVVLAVSALVSTTAVVAPLLAEDWNRFRGPNGTGVSTSGPLPVEMGPEINRSWATPVPFGRSSPAITEDRLFLTAVEGERLATLAIDRMTGAVIWKRTMDRPRTEEIYPQTDSSTSSPVTDGSNVFVFFQEYGLISYDATGKERWRFPLGPFRNFYGISSSPVLVGGLVVMVCDQAEGSFLVAVEATNGREAWRRIRSGRLEAYSTPILYPSDEAPTAVLVLGSRWIDAYEPATGDLLWSLPGVGAGPIASLALVGDTVFTSAPNHAENGWAEFSSLTSEHDANGDGVLAKNEVEGVWLFNHFGWLDTDADGSISEADWTNLGEQVSHDKWGVYALRLDGTDTVNVSWNYRSNVPYIPTPLAYRGVLYLVKDDILTALDMESGDLLKKGRLGSGAKVYASPVAADGKIFIATLDGRILVLEEGSDWTILATNELGGEIWASPAIANGHLYVRTATELFDFSVSASEPKDVARTASEAR